MHYLLIWTCGTWIVLLRGFGTKLLPLPTSLGTGESLFAWASTGWMTLLLPEAGEHQTSNVGSC